MRSGTPSGPSGTWPSKYSSNPHGRHTSVPRKKGYLAVHHSANGKMVV